MTEAGPLDLISEDEEEEESGADIKLPGVYRGCMLACCRERVYMYVPTFSLFQVT